ncbi:MAG: hypothetical protein ACTSPM_06400 [Candidatus Heimdallarchaeota archaeon]
MNDENDEQLMKQVREYVVSLKEIKGVRSIQPSNIHNLFMAICRNVALLKKKKKKIEYVLELLKILVLNKKRCW